MATQNLFTTVGGEGPPTYRFHPLFREFLIHRAARDLAPAEMLEARHRAAQALLARGLIEEAAQVLIDAQSWDRLSQVVLGQAPGLMSQGRHGTLRNWLDRIPAARMQDDPWLLYWLGASRAVATTRSLVARAWSAHSSSSVQAGAARHVDGLVGRGGLHLPHLLGPGATRPVDCPPGEDAGRWRAIRIARRSRPGSHSACLSR